MKVGDYVRTNKGIAKYIGDKATKVTIYKVIDKDIVYDNVEGWENILLDKEIIKSSPNIIDLIEVGDYVNGERIQFITNKKELLTDGGYDLLKKYEDIKFVVTKEQFSQMEYKIGE